MIETMARGWWAIVLRGLAAIAFGLMELIWPQLTLRVLVLIFAIWALVNGFLALTAGLGAARREERSSWLITEGVLGIVAGVVAGVWPAVPVFALLFVIAVWAICTGVVQLAAAIKLRRYVRGEWLLGLSGIASIVLGILLFSRPGAGVLALGWLVAFYALLFGVLMVALGLRLRVFALQGRAPV